MTTDVTISQRSLKELASALSKENKAFAREVVRDIMAEISRSATGASMFGAPPKTKQEMDQLIRILGKNRNALSAYEQFLLSTTKRQRAALEAQEKKIKENTEALEDNTEVLEDNTDAHDKQKKTIEQATERTESFIKSLVAGTVSIEGFGRAAKEFQQSYKLGFKWNPIIDSFNSALMGLDPTQMMEFQAQFRRVSNTMVGGVNEFNGTVKATQEEVRKYTGTMASAAVFMGNLYDISASIGIKMDDVGSSADGLFDQFKRMQAVTSITADEFVELTRRLVTNSDIQRKLLGLNEQQRGAYVNNLIAQQRGLQLAGVTQEVIEQLQAAGAASSEANNLDRLVGAEKLFLGLTQGLGWSEEKARQLTTLHFNSEAQANDLTSYTRLMGEMQESVQLKRRSGVEVGRFGAATTTGLFTDAIMESLGLTDLMNNPAAQQAQLQLKAGARQDTILNQMHQIAERDSGVFGTISGNVTRIADTLNAWSPSAIAVIAGAAVGYLLSSTGIVGKIMNKVIPTAQRRAQAAASTGRRYMPGGRVMGGIGLMGAGAAGYGLLQPDVGASRGSLMVHGMMSGAMTGLGAGMMIRHPAAMAAGLIIGAIGGAYAGLRNYQEDFLGKLNETSTLSSQLTRSEHDRIASERERIRAEIAASEEMLLNARGQADAAERARIEITNLNNELANLNKQEVATDVISQAGIIASANTVLGSMLTDTSISKGSELSNRLSTLMQISKDANLNIDPSSLLASQLRMSQYGETSTNVADLQEIITGIGNGTLSEVDIPAPIRAMVQRSIVDVIKSVQTGIGNVEIGSSEADREAARLKLEQQMEIDRRDLARREEELSMRAVGYGFGGTGGSGDEIAAFHDLKKSLEYQQMMHQLLTNKIKVELDEYSADLIGRSTAYNMDRNRGIMMSGVTQTNLN